MANAELSRRVEKLVGYPPLAEMGDLQRREFHEALLDADGFEDLPGKWQAAIVEAEQNRPEQTVYEAAGGYQGLLRLARAWHARVMADELVSHAFSHGFHPDHSQRLAAYWAEALGGPITFSAEYGDQTSVVRMHSGNGVHEEMDRRAIECFDEALTDVGFAGDDRLRQVLHEYFSWATTTTMSRYHRSADDVPDGLEIPHWSWDGLVGGARTDDI
jgi:hemoglobin